MFQTLIARTAGLALIGSIVLGGGTARAGLIVVSGDENISDALVGNGVPINSGNQTFFSNVLGGGTRVDVLSATSDVGGVDTPVANINAFYNSLSGVSSNIIAGPVTGSSLAGINLFIGAIPSSAFSSAEIQALSSFSAAGGAIFLLGDAQNFGPLQDANINALLTGIGSSLRILPANLDAGFQTASGAQIQGDPLTSGVNSFTYAYASEVTGGASLFTATGGQTFVAEENGIPEPATGALLSAGLVGLYLRRRNRRTGA